METKMPAFPIKSVNQLADYLYPVTPEIAAKIAEQANSVEDGICYAAVYYFTGTPENKKRASMLIVFYLETADDRYAYVITDEYHPRKNGKAELEFRTDYLLIEREDED
jgi:hypothetical protein